MIYKINIKLFIKRVTNKFHFVRHVGEELDFPRLLLILRIAMQKTNW